MAEGKLVGKITHYFNNIGVAVIKLSAAIKDGDKIQIKGSSTDVTQVTSSMQIEHKVVKSAKKGQDIGMKVKDRVRPGDAVFIIQ
tara:strand:+ start:69 stop:323 length:255 start_codon:yes stop_codon:yes gene_type:complete